MLLGNGLAAGCNCPWAKVWGASWKAMTKRSSERAGRRDKMFWLPSALDLCLWFTLSCGQRNPVGGGFQASSATAFFHRWRIAACDAFLAALSSVCTELKSLAVVRELASPWPCSCMLVRVAGDPAPKASEKPFWRSLLCTHGWACCFSLTFQSLLLISLV